MNKIKQGWRWTWAMVMRLVRTAKTLSRDKTIPRPLRWGLTLGLLPWPGPVDEIVLVLVVSIMGVFWPRTVASAWRGARRGQ